MYGVAERIENELTSRGNLGYQPGLGRIEALLDALGRPERLLRGALIGGTNGKGSTGAFATAALSEAGVRVGWAPKPHLHLRSERIRIGATPISSPIYQELMTALLWPRSRRLRRIVEECSEFEVLTAAAVIHFVEAQVDVALLEVGVGGKSDATCAVPVTIKAVTNIGRDHLDIIGPTMADLVSEKAGIVRPDDVAICGPCGEWTDELHRNVRVRGPRILMAHGRDFGAERRDRDNADLYCGADRVREVRLALAGDHQVANAGVAFAIVSAVASELERKVSDAHVRSGFQNVTWPGRFEKLMIDERPAVLDGAHNCDGVRALVDAVEGQSQGASVVAVFGAFADKDIELMLASIPPSWRLVCTSPNSPRALSADDLAQKARTLGRTVVAVKADPAEAIQASNSVDGGLVVIFGSLVLIAEARAFLGVARVIEPAGPLT